MVYGLEENIKLETGWNAKFELKKGRIVLNFPLYSAKLLVVVLLGLTCLKCFVCVELQITKASGCYFLPESLLD